MLAYFVSQPDWVLLILQSASSVWAAASESLPISVVSGLGAPQLCIAVSRFVLHVAF